jgi:hypothetical protein
LEPLKAAFPCRSSQVSLHSVNASPSAVGCIRCPIRAIRFEPRRDLLRFWWFTGVKFLFAKWVKIAPRRTPSAEGAPDLGHLRLPEEPVGGSAAVPNLFARAICAHMIQVQPPICPFCRRPMKLSRTISKTAFPLFLFHCRPCNHTTTKQQKLAQPAVCEPGRRGPRNAR